MLKDQNIICFSNDWDQDPLSKHHIMGRLAKHNRVLWVDSVGMRRPTASRQDVAKIVRKVSLFFRSAKKVQENLFVVTPLVIPFHGNGLIRTVNGFILPWQLKSHQRKLGMKDAILWSFLPNVESVFGNLGEKLKIYYITDDFAHFSGHPGEAIDRMEQSLIKKCDIVIASAKRLAEKKSVTGKEIKIVCHGVNHGHFARALSFSANDWPADIREIKHPFIGFYGEINDWLDLEMVADAAKKRSEWSFVLLGRIGVEVGDIGFLTDMPNVHWLGQKRFEDLPRYCSAFDVALIPMKLNELTLSVNPLKLREYLAAGVPVVSAPLPEVLPYSDVVKFAKTSDELIKATEEWLREDRRELAPVLSKRVANESWDSRVEEISKIIEAALAVKKACS